MKPIIRLKIVLLLAYWGVSLMAGAQALNKAEYFIDTDPGVGNGTAINIGSPADSLNINFNISLTGLNNGLHVLTIRFRDTSGYWSISDTRSFNIIPHPDTTTFKIEKAEYFLDSDPGAGNGQPITTGALADSVIKSQVVPLTSLPLGLHTLNVRVKNNKGIWGATDSRSFNVVDLTTSPTTKITSAEYFIDNDPGTGLATPLSISKTDSFKTQFNISLAGIAPGYHNIHVRVKDSTNVWSIDDSKTFNIFTPDAPTAPIASFEYYYDTEPGIGKGKQLDYAMGDSITLDTIISSSGLIAGNHIAYIRAKDTSGVYGLYDVKPFTICDVLPQAAFKADTACSGLPVKFVNLTTGGDVNTQYLWDVNNDGVNDFVDSVNLTYKYASSGSYNVRLIATNGGACADTFRYTAVVYMPLYDSITVSGPTTFCQGNSVTLNSLNAFAQYKWSNDSTTSSIVVTQSGLYSLVASNGKCSATTNTVTVTVNPIPAKPTITNIGGALQSSSNTGNQWYSGITGLLAGETNQIFVPAETGDYYTIVTQNTCVSNPSDNAHFVYDSLNCYTDYSFIVDNIGKSVSFTNLATSATNTKWDFGDGSTSYLVNPIHPYAKNGTYNVCLTAVDTISGCLKKVCKTVVVGNSGCNADFTYSIDNVTNTVTVTDISSGTTDWLWDFGDGVTDKTQNTSHKYKTNGTFNIYHWVNNKSTGCYDFRSKTIQVGSTDTTFVNAMFTYFVPQGSNKVTFSDKSTSNVTSWYWTFGDGNYAATQNPVYDFGKSGKYNVCLKVYDKVSGKTGSYCEEVSVGSDSCALVSAFSFVKADSTTLDFYNQSTGNIGLYYWSFGDGSSSTLNNPTHHFIKPGNYLVSLSIKNAQSQCTDYHAEFVKIGSAGCKASFDYSYNPDTKEVVFSNNSLVKNQRSFWYFGDGQFSTEANPIYKYSGDGLYQVSLTTSDTLNNCMDIYTAPVQVGQVKCNAHFTWFVDSTTNTVYLQNEVMGSSTNLQWTFGDGQVSYQQNPSHHFTKPGFYKISLNTFNSVNWCMDYYEETILIGKEGNDCKADFIYQPESTDNTIDFFDLSTGDIIGYLWNFGDGDIKPGINIKHKYASGGYYNVCHLVVNNKNVSNITCKTVKVASTNGDDCYADFNFSIDSVTKTAYFKDMSSGKPNKWLWNLGNNQFSTDSAGSAQYQGGYYLVSLSIKNTLSNCVSKTYKLVNINQSGGLKAGFGYDPQNISMKAGGYPVDFVGAGIGDQSKLKWDFGDGTTDSTTTTPSHEYTAPGKYRVCYTLTDEVTGESNTFCDSVSTSITCSNDTHAPTASCKDINVTLDGSGNAVITADMINNGSMDDCAATVSLSADKLSFTEANIGSNQVTLTVKDDMNHTSTCISNVNVSKGTGINSLSLVSGLQISPNPANNFANISFELKMNALVEISVYDIVGKNARTIIKAYKQAGNQNVLLNSSDMKPGSYIIEVKAQNQNTLHKVLIIK